MPHPQSLPLGGIPVSGGGSTPTYSGNGVYTDGCGGGCTINLPHNLTPGSAIWVWTFNNGTSAPTVCGNTPTLIAENTPGGFGPLYLFIWLNTSSSSSCAIVSSGTYGAVYAAEMAVLSGPVETCTGATCTYSSSSYGSSFSVGPLSVTANDALMIAAGTAGTLTCTGFTAIPGLTGVFLSVLYQVVPSTTALTVNCTQGNTTPIAVMAAVK
jgi:hypothetical protein